MSSYLETACLDYNFRTQTAEDSHMALEWVSPATAHRSIQGWPSHARSPYVLVSGAATCNQLCSHAHNVKTVSLPSLARNKRRDVSARPNVLVTHGNP